MSDNPDKFENFLSNRREYGTPIDLFENLTPSQDRPPIYFANNLDASTSKNDPYNPKYANNITKKGKNRRKKREDKVRSSKIEKDQNHALNDSANLDQLTNNLKKVLSIQNETEKSKNLSDLNEKSKSKKSEVRSIAKSNKNEVKVFTNSRYKNHDNCSEKSKKSVEKQTPNKKKFNKSLVDEEIQFEDYLSLDLVKDGLANGGLFKGNIRINPKDYQTAYISNPVKTENDITIEGLKDRNRALDGDKVIYKIKEDLFWKTPKHKTAKVVHILELVHPRTAIGTLRLALDKNKQFAIFHPRDPRVPRMKILFIDWPPLFYDNADKYENVLYLAKIKEWPTSKFAFGTLLENLGTSGDIKIETAAILKENSIDTSPYPDSFKKFFNTKISGIPEEEMKNRLDLRKELIFTIDPLTARDLDDAVSCKRLDNGNYEVGVHISDVTYYLDEGTQLDKVVCDRATSTYMVESVYHMLPKELCFACSLLPGEDKLAFSVIWELKEDGEIVNHRFARTIINSCTQLAYEHAQKIIDDPNCQLTTTDLPQIHNDYQPEDIKKTIEDLYKISMNLRKTRFDSGALRIDQLKLCFRIDPETCMPLSFQIYEQKESHRLIEEFMLLANMTVAEFLNIEYPDIAFLRCHPRPNDLMMEKLKELLEKVGILLDISSAGAFQKSLWAYSGPDSLSTSRMLVLSHLSAKTMNRAEYFCTGLPRHSEIDEEFDLEDYCWHYALNIPLYTHFTSPIRRYADVMVHRLLAGALGCTERPNWMMETVADIAGNCNRRKYNAKKAGEQSLELYYMQYVSKMGSLVEDAVVCDVRETSFDVIVTSSGITCRVFLNTLPKRAVYKIQDDDGMEIILNNGRNNPVIKEKRGFTPDKKIKTVIINWPDRNPNNPPKQQLISMFTIVRLKIYKNDKKLKLVAELLKPQ